MSDEALAKAEGEREEDMRSSHVSDEALAKAEGEREEDTRSAHVFNEASAKAEGERKDELIELFKALLYLERVPLAKCSGWVSANL